MAKATGGDVILTLMTQVVDVREGLADLRQGVDQALQGMVVMKRGADQMDLNLARMGLVINVMVDTMKSRFDDHEARIAALERKVGGS